MEIAELITKSERALKSAQRQTNEGDYDFAVSRTYYALFYIVEAALLTLGLTTSKQSGIIALFNQHFIKTGIFDKRLNKLLNDAFDLRQQGDYWSNVEITRDVAERLLTQAGVFIQVVKKHIEGISGG